MRRTGRAWCCLTAAFLCASLSCGRAPDADALLTKQADEIESLTVPPNAEALFRSSVDRNGVAVKIHWDFETAWTRNEYGRWLTEQLQPKFEIARNIDSRLAFARYSGGETESIDVGLAPKADRLHVRIGLSIYPD